MNKWPMLILLLLLNACASQVALIGADGVPPATGTLRLTWLEPHAMEIRLDGKRYVGEWTSSPCATDECRGVYRGVPRIHRRHIREGRAVLVAQDGSRIECEWVSHLPDVDGNCKTQDGRVYKLKSA